MQVSSALQGNYPDGVIRVEWGPSDASHGELPQDAEMRASRWLIKMAGLATHLGCALTPADGQQVCIALCIHKLSWTSAALPRFQVSPWSAHATVAHEAAQWEDLHTVSLASATGWPTPELPHTMAKMAGQ